MSEKYFFLINIFLGVELANILATFFSLIIRRARRPPDVFGAQVGRSACAYCSSPVVAANGQKWWWYGLTQIYLMSRVRVWHLDLQAYQSLCRVSCLRPIAPWYTTVIPTSAFSNCQLFSWGACGPNDKDFFPLLATDVQIRHPGRVGCVQFLSVQYHELLLCLKTAG